MKQLEKKENANTELWNTIVVSVSPSDKNIFACEKNITLTEPQKSVLKSHWPRIWERDKFKKKKFRN